MFVRLPQLCRVADWRDQDSKVALYQKLPPIVNAVVAHMQDVTASPGSGTKGTAPSNAGSSSSSSSSESSDGSDYTTDDGSDDGDSFGSDDDSGGKTRGTPGLGDGSGVEAVVVVTDDMDAMAAGASPMR